MPVGSRLYLSWWDFCGYLSDFEDFVYILFQSFRLYFRLTHVKDLNGHYVNIAEWDNKKKYLK